MSDPVQSEARDVFISYHTQSAGETVRKICAALEGAGITCWYAPRNVGANYAQSIVEAIRHCRVFLLILNKESNLSAHVLNEINCAFDRFRNHEDITLLPFRIDQCQLSDDVYYYLGRIHIMDGALPPEVQRVRELVDRVSVVLDRRCERTVTTAPVEPGVQAAADIPAGRTFRLTGSLVYPDSRFVGRGVELEAIHRALSGPENKLFLVGMGGIGKSEIAKMYLKQHQGDYDVILWISFSGSLTETIASDYAVPIQGMSRTDYPEDSDEDYFRRKLRVLKEIGDRRVLLVMDNFDVPGDEKLREFCGGAYTVLFTTRFHQEDSAFPQVEVREMTDEADLLALFRAEYTRTLDGAGLEQVRDIIRQLSGHTLSIRLVASAMQHRRIQPEKMAKLLRSGAESMARENVKAADMIFGQLRQVFSLSTLSDEEQYLLKNLVLVPLSGMPVETLFDWCEAEDFDVIDELIRKSWVIHNPATDEVHLHPLVADLMAGEAVRDIAVWEKFVGRLYKETNACSSEPFDVKQRYYAYSQTAMERVPVDSALHRLALYANAHLTMDMARYKESARIYAMLLEGSTDIAEKANLYGNVAHCLTMSTEVPPEECMVPAKMGYEILKDIPEDELTHEQGVEKVFLLHRMAEISLKAGDYASSVKYARQSIPLGAKFSRKSMQNSVGWSLYHLSYALMMQGNLDEAKESLERALELYAQIGDEWSASYARNLLGQVQMRRGCLEEALKLSMSAYEVIARNYGAEHADTAYCLEWRGNIYRAMGDGENARSCYAQAAAVYHKLNFAKREARALAAARGEQD